METFAVVVITVVCMGVAVSVFLWARAVSGMLIDIHDTLDMEGAIIDSTLAICIRDRLGALGAIREKMIENEEYELVQMVDKEINELNKLYNEIESEARTSL